MYLAYEDILSVSRCFTQSLHLWLMEWMPAHYYILHPIFLQNRELEYYEISY
jgi:hypothetical protein